MNQNFGYKQIYYFTCENKKHMLSWNSSNLGYNTWTDNYFLMHSSTHQLIYRKKYLKQKRQVLAIKENFVLSTFAKQQQRRRIKLKVKVILSKCDTINWVMANIIVFIYFYLLFIFFLIPRNHMKSALVNAKPKQIIKSLLYAHEHESAYDYALYI